MTLASARAGLIPAETRQESVWDSPLVPAALALTAGVVLDRVAGVPFWFSLLAGAVLAAGVVVETLFGRRRMALVFLALGGAALGCAYQHFQRELYAADDVGRLVGPEPRPVRVLGLIEDEPRRLPPGEDDPLRSRPTAATASTVLNVAWIDTGGGEQAASGRVRLIVSADAHAPPGPLLAGLHPGDEIEVRGRLAAAPEPGNPGEFDLAGYWRDRGVRALLLVRQGNSAVKRERGGWWWSLSGWLAVVRGWGHATLDGHLPAHAKRVHRAVSGALLLGEGAPMTREDWAKYVRTGVLHVLAISGQHLVVVGLFLWFVLRLLGVRQRRAAVVVAGVMLGYALLTGGRPPAMRSAVGCCVVCGGMVLRRPPLPANLFALSWLVVLALNPADVFDLGCQLSFLSVGVLCWGVGRVNEQREEEDPLDALIDRSRPWWLRALRWCGRWLLENYLVCLLVWLGIAPLAAYRTGMLAPSALLLGPPLTVLTSVALFAGFALLALAPWFAPAAKLAGWVVWVCLSACDGLVDLAEGWATHVFVGALPLWWVAVYHAWLLAWLTQPAVRRAWRWALAAGLGWLCVGLLAGAVRPNPDGLTCTFLAVGHGGCTVLELPDGRVVLYDAGTIGGPEVTARVVAPFLWSRNIHRIDDVVLSHADLDHFNGLPALLDRFAVGRVLLSPTFREKPTPAVRHTLAELNRRRVRVQHLVAGQRLRAAGVTMEVLHPPAGFRLGNANARSVVLEVRCAGHAILLTGDLEGEGLAEVLASPGREVDVLMAPHHGSHRIDVTALAQWCRPGLVVSCQGPPRGAGRAPGLYREAGAVFWATQDHGAVTVRVGVEGMRAETFRTAKSWHAPPRQRPIGEE
jgi:competence protein ComEC